MRLREGSEGPSMTAIGEDEFMAELTEISVEFAPRRFALCGVRPNLEDAQVIGWGMAFDDEAMLYLPEDGTLGRLRSAQRAPRLYGRRGDLRVVWIDGGDHGD